VHFPTFDHAINIGGPHKGAFNENAAVPVGRSTKKAPAMKHKFSLADPISMLIGLSHALLWFGLGLALVAEESNAGAQIEIVVGKEALPLERFAADELAKMLVKMLS